MLGYLNYFALFLSIREHDSAMSKFCQGLLLDKQKGRELARCEDSARRTQVDERQPIRTQVDERAA
jgi:hypothetical protein